MKTSSGEARPDASPAPTTNGGAASVTGGSNGATSPADEGERLVVEASYLTLKRGDGPEVRYDLEAGAGVQWVWTADSNQNRITYTSKTKSLGGLTTFMVNMNIPGKRLNLTKYGKGDPGEMTILLNHATDLQKGQHEAMAISGWVEAKRDAVSGAMVGSFEGVFHDEPMLKPLLVKPEHMGEEVKMSGTFALQPPAREPVSNERIQKVMPNVP